jgi:hypothetical protein
LRQIAEEEFRQRLQQANQNEPKEAAPENVESLPVRELGRMAPPSSLGDEAAAAPAAQEQVANPDAVSPPTPLAAPTAAQPSDADAPASPQSGPVIQ